SSLPMIDPVQPPPMMATSTGGSFSAMLVSMLCVVGLGHGDGHGLAAPWDAMALDVVGKTGVRARKAHQFPAHHVAVAAIHGVREESFDGGFQQGLEKHRRGQRGKIH